MDFNESVPLERVTDDAPQGTTQTASPAPATAAPEPPAPTRENVMARVAEAVQGVMNPPQAAAPAPEATTPPVDTPPAPATVPPVPEQTIAPVEEVATPPIPPVEANPPSAPTHLSRIAELATEPLDQSLPQAVEALREFASYDPQAEDLLYRSVLAANWEHIQTAVLAQYGVPQERVNEFAAWVKGGAVPLATPTAEPAFPEPNADNIVRMWDGQEAYDLDLNDPRDRQLYDLSKRDYENRIEQRKAEQSRAQAEAEQTRKAQEQAAVQQQQQIETRHREFNSARAASLVKAIEPALPKLEGEDAALLPILMHSIRGALETMTYQVDEKGAPATELGRLYAQAKSYVEQGAGKTEEFARRIDTLTAIEAKKIIDTFNRFILKENKAEVALTATAPQIPAAVQPMTVQTPPAPQTQKPQNREEWVASIMARTNQALSSLPVTPR